MAFDLQEQEQIDAAKAFWQQWGKWISLAVIVVALGYLGYQGWKYYRSHQAEQAALLYAPVETAVTEGDAGKLVASAKALQDAYPKSGYAARASLLAARVAFDKGDTKTAEQELLWVAGNAAEPAVKAVAQLRKIKSEAKVSMKTPILSVALSAASEGVEAIHAALGDIAQAGRVVGKFDLVAKHAEESAAEGTPETEVAVEASELGEPPAKKPKH